MENFRVLLLEDNATDADHVLEALQDAGFPRRLCASWEDALSTLQQEHYDLVIADLFIYEHEAEKAPSGEGRFFCLDHLLEITEGRHPPIPVVVYTGKQPLAQLLDYHPRICDFWWKQDEIHSRLLAFRIRKIRDLMERERTASELMKVLETELHYALSARTIVPFADQINNMLVSFKTYDTGLDRATAMISELSTIAGQFGCAQTFGQSLNALKDVDSACSRLLHGRRPHLAHAINTFLLGYYILNLARIPWRDILFGGDSSFQDRVVTIGRRKGCAEAEAIDVAWREVNGAWFCAALLHDVGKVVQDYSQVVNHMRKAVEELNVTVPFKPEKPLQLQKGVSDELVSAIARAGAAEDVEKCVRAKKSLCEHGTVSGAFIAKHCHAEAVKAKNAEGDFCLSQACQAVAIHDSLGAADFPELDLVEQPIAALLAFCDSVQAWDRESPEFSVLAGDLIDKVELTELEVIERDGLGPELRFTVKYYPHNMVAHHAASLGKALIDLRTLLQAHVIGPLQQSLKYTGRPEFRPNFRVTFQLGHRTIGKPVEVPVTS